MKRLAFEKLKEWKESKYRKPLIIQGARQVGKTWLMTEFGRTQYQKTAYINFENNADMWHLFEADMNIDRILAGLSMATGVHITPSDTLIIFDEVQENPNALNSLKYFYEQKPEYHIMAAGSLLGVSLTHQGKSFPVGKVDFLTLYPMTFCEFLDAIGEEAFCETIQNQNFQLITAFKNKYTDLLKTYFYVGGMPEVVSKYSETKDFSVVRNTQNALLEAYVNDFSKHIAPLNIPKVNMIWRSIPSQLSKENKKFKYSLLKEGSRAKDFEDALMWLVRSGLVYKVNRIDKAGIPLYSYEDNDFYKLYMLDTGLLCAMSLLDAKTLLSGNRIFEEFKGSLTEQYVLQEFKALRDIPVGYWSNRNTEVDFVVQIDAHIVPVEVKAGINLKAKSLKSYMNGNNPEIAVRTSLADYKTTDNLIDIPLCAIEQIKNIINQVKH
jgi:hypothetical protein